MSIGEESGRGIVGNRREMPMTGLEVSPSASEDSHDAEIEKLLHLIRKELRRFFVGYIASISMLFFCLVMCWWLLSREPAILAIGGILVACFITSIAYLIMTRKAK